MYALNKFHDRVQHCSNSLTSSGRLVIRCNPIRHLFPIHLNSVWIKAHGSSADDFPALSSQSSFNDGGRTRTDQSRAVTNELYKKGGTTTTHSAEQQSVTIQLYLSCSTCTMGRVKAAGCGYANVVVQVLKQYI